jgi:uncharacterized protein YndB with AHSA1/START domain
MNPTTISCFRSFRPPVAEVWLHLTRPDLLARWVGAADLDLRHDGEVALEVWNGDRATGRILAVAPPVRMEMAWRPFGIGPESHVTLRLEGDGPGSRLTVTHDGLRTEAERRHSRLTWKEALLALRRSVHEETDAHEWGESIPVTIRLLMPRAASDLWPLISTAAGLGKWVARVDRFDGETGGEFRFVSKYQGREIVEAGRIEEVVPESRVVLAWEWIGEEWGAMTKLELALETDASGTSLLINHGGFDRIDPARRLRARKNYVAAWVEVAADLKRLVAPVAV